MILTAVLCVAMGQAEPVKDWHQADLAGQIVNVWGYPVERDGVKRIRWVPEEQAEAHRKHPHYLTGVVPGKMEQDTKQIRASDQAAADYGQAVLKHSHEAGKPCPDGGKCPNKPKEPAQPEARRTPNIPFSQETLAAVALVVAGLFFFFRGSNGQRAE